MDDLRTLAERVRHLEMELKRDRHPSVPYKAGVEATRYGNTTARFIPLTTPLTSTAWDGDSFSTTGKTLIDLSDVFGAPAGIKAISAYIYLRDSGSAGSNTTYFGLSPNDTDGQVAFACASRGLTNDYFSFEQGIVPCDANGDVYYQCIATGSNTLDVWLEIWGYWL